MSQVAEQRTPEVTPEEVARRIAEWRRVAFEHRAPVTVAYHPPHHPCPWPGCEARIAGIRFNLEHMYGPAEYDAAVTSFWQGPGLVARCPGCGRYVLFGLQEKQIVTDPTSAGAMVLRDDWQETAYIVQKPKE